MSQVKTQFPCSSSIVLFALFSLLLSFVAATPHPLPRQRQRQQQAQQGSTQQNPGSTTITTSVDPCCDLLNAGNTASNDDIWNCLIDGYTWGCRLGNPAASAATCCDTVENTPGFSDGTTGIGALQGVHVAPGPDGRVPTAPRQCLKPLLEAQGSDHCLPKVSTTVPNTGG